jgi:hypothetical protein
MPNLTTDPPAVRTGGEFGGYHWGIHVKRWLLTHEGRVPETRS